MAFEPKNEVDIHSEVNTGSKANNLAEPSYKTTEIHGFVIFAITILIITGIYMLWKN